MSVFEELRHNRNARQFGAFTYCCSFFLSFLLTIFYAIFVWANPDSDTELLTSPLLNNSTKSFTCTAHSYSTLPVDNDNTLAFC